MNLNISKEFHLGFLNLKIYSPIKFCHDHYISMISKKLQWPCGLQDFKIPQLRGIFHSIGCRATVIVKVEYCIFQDEELARQLVELGYRGSGEVLKREEFEARKAAAEASRLSKKSQQKLVLANWNSIFLKINY